MITDISVSTLKNQLNSPLLRLPAEIRNKVYTYAILSARIMITRAPEMNRRDPSLYFELPGLHMSCKQIWHEATALLPSRGTFDVSDDDEQFLLSRGLSPTISNLVTSVRISGSLACYIRMLAPYSRWRGTNWPVSRYLPNLEEIVYVKEVVEAELQGKLRKTLNVWTGDASIEIIFEEMLD